MTLSQAGHTSGTVSLPADLLQPQSQMLMSQTILCTRKQSACSRSFAKKARPTMFSRTSSLCPTSRLVRMSHYHQTSA